MPVAALVGLCAWLVHLGPIGDALHRDWSLPWLFALRGERSSPESVTIVHLDRPMRLDGASRTYDIAELRGRLAMIVDALSRAGACVIVFDIALERASSPTADRALADAIRASDRVVLFQRLRRTTFGDVIVRPVSELTAASRALGVFPLPKLPGRVDFFWSRFPAFHATGRDTFELKPAVSLPLSALRLARQRNREDSACADIGRDVDRVFQSARAVSASRRVPLNFYGPAHTLRTIHHRQLIADRSPDSGDRPAAHLERGLAGPGSSPERDPVADDGSGPDTAEADGSRHVEGRAVFVGQSGDAAIDQLDGFRTVYTDRHGLDLSGVEIAATAFANAVDGSALRPLEPGYVALAFLVIALTISIPTMRGAVWTIPLALLLTSAAALWIGRHLMLARYQTFPLAGLLLIDVPLALLASTTVRYVWTEKRRRRLHEHARLVLPSQALDTFEEAGDGHLANRAARSRWVTCLITDIEGYTSLAETLPHDQLDVLTREYFAALSNLTTQHEGELLDVLGDGMTAIWTRREPCAATARQACRAVLAMQTEISAFNERHRDTPFNTRFGLHSGWISAGHYGSRTALRYRLVGDVMNSASRLEALNKWLGTRVLVSRDVIETSAGSVIARPLGRFLLPGKARPIETSEPLCATGRPTATDEDLRRRFVQVLRLLDTGQRDAARGRLACCLRAFPDDRPCRFYLELLKDGQMDGVRMDDDGTIRILRK